MLAILPGVEPLTWGALPDPPPPGPGQVRLAVRATALNRADLLQRRGAYPPPPGASPVPGLECAGVLEAVGPGVRDWREGDEACALLAGGGHASRALCPASHLLPVPRGLSLEEAASLPEVWATAWLNLVEEGGLRPGERVLLHAGASGVGTAALQLCRLRGAHPFVVVGREEKLEACLALGAEGGALRAEGAWVEAARRFAPEGFHLALDPVGGPTLRAELPLMAEGGRVALIGLMGGRGVELDLALLLRRRLRLQGSTLRGRADEEKARLLAALRAEVWPAFERGALRPVIAARLPIERAEEAHALLASDATVGKIVLTMP